MSGPALRDEGHARVLAASSAWWVSCCRQALRTLAEQGQPFTVDTLRDMGVPEPHHPNAWGAVTKAASKAGLIRQVGWTEARRPEARRRGLRQWVGTQVDAA